MTDAKPRPGGWSEEAPVTEEVKKICIEAGKQAGVKFDVCVPETFKYQIVAGKNYLVKVKVSEDNKYLHVNIYQALPVDGGDLSVTGVQYPKPRTDPLVPF
ncbi:cystatin-B-like [Pimephales promelas]|uniref:cystatin-B-like n=1 Tax=Pimephales promelas TaxID=90988 RepID=UPI001955E4F2|nr:cystatin-B-like [Pimephales promelas]KAG1931580.1 cystatin 14a, tandem [Pimephales promelas]